MNHTPGPWRVGKTGGVVADVPVPEVSGSEDVDYYGGHLICESITRRNAVLVAAAPDLLYALKALRNNVERDLSGYWTESTSNFMQQADAAIAKAEGRA